MKFIKIDPLDYPIQKDESWWIVHPNKGKSEFYVPKGAITVCIKEFLDFSEGTAYRIVSSDYNNGYLVVESKESMVEMPQYLFARHFDAECFVRGIPTPKERQQIEHVIELRQPNYNFPYCYPRPYIEGNIPIIWQDGVYCGDDHKVTISNSDGIKGE